MIEGLTPLSKFIINKYQKDVSNLPLSIPLKEPFEHLISNVFIAPNQSPKIQSKAYDKWDYDQLLQYCKQQLIQNGSKTNSLCDGYLTNLDNSVNSLRSKSLKLNDHVLKSTLWRIIQSVIGNVNMSDLFLNYSGFLYENNGFLHLFGDSLKAPKKQYASKPDKTLIKITLDKALYVKSSQIPHLDPLVGSKLKISQNIFKDEYLKLKNPKKQMKKLKTFYKIIDIITKNHKSLRYSYIVKNICKEFNQAEDNLQLALDKKLVIKCCTIIFEKLFPRELFGSNHNKSIIITTLAKFINLNHGEYLSLHNLLQDIRIKDIPWLGNTKVQLNKQDFEKRLKLIKQLMIWLFNSFFIKILSSFFHITHISASKTLLYFHHSTWDRISKKFKYNYIEKYLQYKEIQTNNDVIKGNLRLFPKKNNDFRTINVPIRGVSALDIDRYELKLKEIKIIRQTLNRLRFNQEIDDDSFVKLRSLKDIPLYLHEFKLRLNKTFKEIPALFFLKFDVKACYENLPKENVEKVLNKLINHNNHYISIERQMINLHSSKHIKREKIWTSENIDIGSQINESGNLSFNDLKTSYCSGNLMLQSLLNQLKNSLTKIGPTYYQRKDGVFQGLHYSSLFNDILYDALIREKFGFIKESSLILRIADDFLIISSDLNHLKKISRMVNKGFPEYGVEVNRTKTSVNFKLSQSASQSQDISGERYEILNFTEDEIIFCGYQLNTTTLNIVKLFDELLVSSKKNHSDLVDQLFNLYKLKMNFNTLNLKINSKNTIKVQAEMIFDNIIQSYIQLTKDKDIGVQKFLRFCEDLIIGMVTKLKTNDKKLINQLKDLLRTTFKRQLAKKNTKYHSLIQLL
ncbi:hypothetical protein WICMUC_001666 [Wickerhamomyces mucosus]|uniref:Telomerase reverse transcriptase n=1 Tax=Wickerhamomyces mucosus TaxID=1378264 RepID=A0A9P8PV42_9ASCO|nr:hypothetical protein WICMUC_001666 [Wickerhamomyces mucosus]